MIMSASQVAKLLAHSFHTLPLATHPSPLPSLPTLVGLPSPRGVLLTFPLPLPLKKFVFLSLPFASILPEYPCHVYTLSLLSSFSPLCSPFRFSSSSSLSPTPLAIHPLHHMAALSRLARPWAT